MTSDESLLETMIERVTNPVHDKLDNLAVEMFCMIVLNNSDLIKKVHELILQKICSPNITEATRAVGLLEECMSKGGLEFQKKTAKFTFLNELIVLVLAKNPSTLVPIETKKRIMECLLLWTVEHQDKSKIQEAYNNLKRQVNFLSEPLTATSSVCEQRTNILGKDDQLVAKLIKQGGEENCKKANLLIQHRFNQETRRAEFICHLKSELKNIESAMKLLDEMLNSYSSDTYGSDSRDTIQELYNTCKSHNKQMERWPDFLSDGEPEFLGDVLNTKELLSFVMQRYKEHFDNDVLYTQPSDILPTTSAAITVNTPTTLTAKSDLLSELIGETFTTFNEVTTSALASSTRKTNNKNTAMDELSEIFGNINENMEANKKPHPSNLLGNLDMLEPISIHGSASDTELCASTINNNNEKKTTQGFKELREIDKLSDELFKQSLKEEQRIHLFKKDYKLTLNDMAKDKMLTSGKASEEAHKKINTALTCNEENPIITNLESDLDDVTIGLKEKNKKLECKENNENSKEILSAGKKLDHITKPDDTSVGLLKPLAEISVDLDEITPLDEGQRQLFDDDDIQVTLNFTANRPEKHVSVIVMTVTNKSSFYVRDFQFEASAKKPCKIRLLPPTDKTMGPTKPFRPSPPINQIILLSNPTQNPVDIICIIGYRLGDDPDAIKESIVAKDIPFV